MQKDDSVRRTVRHFSGPVHCTRRAATALVSVVEREQDGLRLHSVLWCSLRGDEQWCGEDCLAGVDAAAPVDSI